MLRILTYCFVSFLLLHQVCGQVGDGDTTKLDSTERALLSAFYDMSIEQLDSIKAGGVSSELEKVLNSLISTSTSQSLSARNDPAITTLITREEIRRSGARDLIDVLRLVPGFHFAQDEGGQVGLGIRGNWTNEGKVLLIIDGQEMNDIFTSKLYFGNHYPVDLIERIEVIRGPGSALYGGFAAFGVINITTRNAETFVGAEVGATRGAFEDEVFRRNQYGYFGTRWRKGAFNISVFTGQSQRSTGTSFGEYSFLDSAARSRGLGQFGSLRNNSDLNPAMVNIYLRLGKFSFRNISDFYEVRNTDFIDTLGNRPLIRATQSNYTEFKYDIHLLRRKIRITPRFNAIFQVPVYRPGVDSIYRSLLEESLTSRLRANLTVSYDITHRINLTVGAESFADNAIYIVNNPLLIQNDTLLTSANAALFGQIILKTRLVNFTGGLRYDINSIYGDAYSPRVGVTKTFNRLHFKLLGSAAFRAPTLGNFAQSLGDEGYDIVFDSLGLPIGLTNFDREIEAEQTIVAEAEIGYQFTDDLFGSINVFAATNFNPIVYDFRQDDRLVTEFGSDAGFFAYTNEEQSGTRGVELALRFKRRKLDIQANYSFYTVSGLSRIPTYSVRSFSYNPDARNEVETSQLLAFPHHRINLNGTWEFHKNWSLNLNGSYYSPRFGYDLNGLDPATGLPDAFLRRFRREFLVNTFFQFHTVKKPRIEIGIGAYDLLDQRFKYLQPYFGLDAPLPGPGREWILKASIDLNFRGRHSPCNP
ncbi:MAG: TonB-dependent receptor plug domain-containing protein [Bacteroidota bacterium]